MTRSPSNARWQSSIARGCARLTNEFAGSMANAGRLSADLEAARRPSVSVRHMRIDGGR